MAFKQVSGFGCQFYEVNTRHWQNTVHHAGGLVDQFAILTSGCLKFLALAIWSGCCALQGE